MVAPPSADNSDPAKVATTDADHPVKYKIKLTRCLLFYIVVPAIPVSLLVIGFLYLIDTPPVIKPTSLPSVAVAKQQQHQHQPPKEVLIERLPHDLKPSSYIITLKTYLPYKPGVDFGPRNLTVDGRVFISFYCQKQTNKIIINANNLIISESKLRLWDEDTKDELPVRLAEIRNETHILEFVTEQPMLVGHNYSMDINYGTWIHKPNDGGLFLGSYMLGNETRYHMVSQMQPIHARRVFPCFDEPEFKAKFQINVVHPNGTTAVSNTKLQRVFYLRDKNWLQSEFFPTPKMSTYLLALAITDFPYIQTYYKHIKIRIWAPPALINDTHHVLNLLPKILDYYENYFGIPYPLFKLDVYVVKELRVIAMENWGLITARDNNIVFHEATSTVNEKMNIENTLFHEVAHMWFGNLITMRWWNDLWLNEGFATHMAQIAAKNLTVETDSIESLNELRTLQTMGHDETLTKQALSFKVEKRSGITLAFDGITYYKGAAVLRLLETIVGPAKFQSVLRDFILKHLHDNADSDDFIRSIIRSLGTSNPFGKHDLDASIRSWTHNIGFPLVTSTRINSTSIRLSQKCYSRAHKIKITPNHTWTIPLYFKKDFAQTHVDVTMLHGNESLILHNVALLDPEFTGYFKVFYDAQTFDAIMQQLYKNHTVLSTRTRAKLLYDTSTLFFAGHTEVRHIMDLFQYMKSEDNVLPYHLFNLAIDNFYYVFSGDPQLEQMFKSFCIFILAGPFDRYFSKSLTHQRNHEGLGKVLILKTCVLNHTPCIDYVRDKFSKLRIACATKKLSENCNFIIPGHREALYAMALRHGTSEDFEFLFDKLLIETDIMERLHIGRGLSGTLNETLSIRTFDYHIYNGSPDEGYCVSFYNCYTMEVIRPYFTKMFRKYYNMLAGSKLIKRCVNIVVKVRIHESFFKPVDDFIAAHADMKGVAGILKNARDVLNNLMKLRDQHASKLAQYLHEFSNDYLNETDATIRTW